jgi:hypothetical protein
MGLVIPWISQRWRGRLSASADAVEALVCVIDEADSCGAEHLAQALPIGSAHSRRVGSGPQNRSCLAEVALGRSRANQRSIRGGSLAVREWWFLRWR